jgi:putative peptidoglycan lipid II flippase
VHRILGLMAPALLGVSVAQLSLLINTQIASQLGVGAVSWLFFADRLMEFPTALLGVALGSVLLPQLSSAQGRGDAAGYSGLLDWGLRLVLMLALPCAVALTVFPAPLIAVLFHHGAFTAHDVAQTAAALRGYGFGLLGLIAVKVLATGFYARQDVRTPVKIAIGVLIATQLMNLALVPWLGVAGLAWSIGLGALGNAAFLLHGLHRRGAYVPQPGWGRFAAQVVAGCVVLGAALATANQAIDWLALGAHWPRRVGLMALVLPAAAAAYLGTLWLVGVRWQQFRRRG